LAARGFNEAFIKNQKDQRVKALEELQHNIFNSQAWLKSVTWPLFAATEIAAIHAQFGGINQRIDNVVSEIKKWQKEELGD
jgi:hypothetical protein